MRELEMDNGRVTERRTDLLECEDCGDTHFSPDWKPETELGDVWD